MKEPSENISPSPLSFSRDSRDFLSNVRDFFNSPKRLAKFARLERDGIRLIFLPLTSRRKYFLSDWSLLSVLATIKENKKM